MFLLPCHYERSARMVKMTFQEFDDVSEGFDAYTFSQYPQVPDMKSIQALNSIFPEKDVVLFLIWLEHTLRSPSKDNKEQMAKYKQMKDYLRKNLELVEDEKEIMA